MSVPPIPIITGLRPSGEFFISGLSIADFDIRSSPESFSSLSQNEDLQNEVENIDLIINESSENSVIYSDKQFRFSSLPIICGVNAKGIPIISGIALMAKEKDFDETSVIIQNEEINDSKITWKKEHTQQILKKSKEKLQKNKKLLKQEGKIQTFEEQFDPLKKDQSKEIIQLNQHLEQLIKEQQEKQDLEDEFNETEKQKFFLAQQEILLEAEQNKIIREEEQLQQDIRLLEAQHSNILHEVNELSKKEILEQLKKINHQKLFIENQSNKEKISEEKNLLSKLIKQEKPQKLKNMTLNWQNSLEKREREIILEVLQKKVIEEQEKLIEKKIEEKIMINKEELEEAKKLIDEIAEVEELQIEKNLKSMQLEELTLLQLHQLERKQISLLREQQLKNLEESKYKNSEEKLKDISKEQINFKKNEASTNNLKLNSEDFEQKIKKTSEVSLDLEQINKAEIKLNSSKPTENIRVVKIYEENLNSSNRSSKWNCKTIENFPSTKIDLTNNKEVYRSVPIQRNDIFSEMEKPSTSLLKANNMGKNREHLHLNALKVATTCTNGTSPTVSESNASFSPYSNNNNLSASLQPNGFISGKRSPFMHNSFLQPDNISETSLSPRTLSRINHLNVIMESKLEKDGAEVIHHHPVFVKDTSKYWYKPTISREEAISMLKPKPPGTFVVRDSNSFIGSFGLALKVAQPPAGVASGDGTELVRHFLIEPSAKGVKLKGCNNEPVFGTLAALVYQHSITPLALPCRLILPDYDPATASASVGDQLNSNQALLERGAACNVTYIGSVDMESLTGPEALRKGSGIALERRKREAISGAVPVHFKVSAQGITLTDNTRTLFFRRHHPTNLVTYAGIDPESRLFDNNNVTQLPPSYVRQAPIFGFVARKFANGMENACHVFAELDPEQPASAVVRFITNVMMPQSHVPIMPSSHLTAVSNHHHSPSLRS